MRDTENIIVENEFKKVVEDIANKKSFTWKYIDKKYTIVTKKGEILDERDVIKELKKYCKIKQCKIEIRREEITLETLIDMYNDCCNCDNWDAEIHEMIIQENEKLFQIYLVDGYQFLRYKK